jgi:hypothetical protein
MQDLKPCYAVSKDEIPIRYIIDRLSDARIPVSVPHLQYAPSQHKLASEFFERLHLKLPLQRPDPLDSRPLHAQM